MRLVVVAMIGALLIGGGMLAALFVIYEHPISFPNILQPNYSHDELVNYALSLINSDRKANGLQNVSLSQVSSAQNHADDMLRNDFFSHWGTDGSKPYMRYTLAGGKGAVAENIAAFTRGAPWDLKAALNSLESNMMNHDAASNWGHRDNILNPFHNEVSIGVSYGGGQAYLVQDFIDCYVEWSTFTVTQSGVSLVGSLSKPMSLNQVNIFYDAQPSNLTNDQLENPPYNGTYTQGTFVGMALPPNYQSQQGITITAQTWVQSGLLFEIRFDLSPAFNAHGMGVYTIYLQTADQDSLTSYSIWHN
jgi:uncharacterized protein YkwD